MEQTWENRTKSMLCYLVHASEKEAYLIGQADFVVVASCSHQFHRKCLMKMSDNNGKVVYPICPRCKKEITYFLLDKKDRRFTFRLGTEYKGELTRRDKTTRY